MKILSTRNSNDSISHDILFSWENAFQKINPEDQILLIDSFRRNFWRVFRNKYFKNSTFANNAYFKMSNLVKKRLDSDLLIMCMNPEIMSFVNMYSPKGLKIAHVIDAWEPLLPTLAKYSERFDIVLVAYSDSIKKLKKMVSPDKMKKFFVFPVFLDSEIYENYQQVEKKVQLFQMGRKNELLHEWALRYSDETGCSYIFMENDERGIYYTDHSKKVNFGKWDGEAHKLSFNRLIKLISSSYISLVSPRNIDNPEITGNISPLSCRYLESAVCNAIPVGFAPTSNEYSLAFPEDFTLVPKNYTEFKEICNKIIQNNSFRETLCKRNREYVINNHSAKTRLKELRNIIAQFQEMH